MFTTAGLHEEWDCEPEVQLTDCVTKSQGKKIEHTALLEEFEPIECQQGFCIQPQSLTFQPQTAFLTTNPYHKTLVVREVCGWVQW